jgi:tRNA threonylcarbamoyladenosine biosynthesis protein TsaB
MSIMKLFIDTSETTKAVVALEIDGKRHEETSESTIDKSQAVLPLIEKLLREQKAKIEDITAISVHPGPGSFTGTRVGVSIANTLAWQLKVPVNDLPLDTFVVPAYAPSKFDSSC